MVFSRQEYPLGLLWPPRSGSSPPRGLNLHCPPPALAGRFLYTSAIWEAHFVGYMEVTKEDTVSTIKSVADTVFYRNTVRNTITKTGRFQRRVTEISSHMECLHSIIQAIPAKKYKLDVHSVTEHHWYHYIKGKGYLKSRFFTELHTNNIRYDHDLPLEHPMYLKQ